jgi:hypothetical protein
MLAAASLEETAVADGIARGGRRRVRGAVADDRVEMEVGIARAGRVRAVAQRPPAQGGAEERAQAERPATSPCATQPSSHHACENACFDAHPSGENEYTALYTCDQGQACASCSAQCGVASCAPVTPPPAEDAGATEVPDSAPPPPLDCSGCTAARCSAEQGACAPASDCDQYSACVLVCGDAACTADCGTAHPTGKAASEALAACTSSQCSTECGF